MPSRNIVFPQPLEACLVEEEAPAVGPEQVLVRSTVSLVSTGTECFCYRGEFDPDTTWARWVEYPFRPGYSLVGVVEDIGDRVEGLEPGARVFAWRQHRELDVIDASSCVRVPDDITDETAAWSALAVITQTAVRRAEHVMGDTAVVIGLGPLGQLVTQYLRALGLQRILAIDAVTERLQVAASNGAMAVHEGDAASAVDLVRRHTDGRLADVVYDVTGHWAVLPLALPLARDFGKVILLGDSPTPSKQRLTQDVLARQVDIIGSHTNKLPPAHAEWTPQRQIGLFFDYVQRGAMQVESLITHRFSPAEAGEVYARLMHKRADTLGVLFEWDRLQRSAAGEGNG